MKLLKIYLKEDSRQFHLSMADNGTGIQDNTDKTEFGKQLIDAADKKQTKAGYTVEITAGTTYCLPFLIEPSRLTTF